MPQTNYEFHGIHNSLIIAVTEMDRVFLQDNFNSLNEHIAAVEEAIFLAEATRVYVRDNKPRAEKNPEGLADKLAEQITRAKQLLDYLYTHHSIINNDELLNCANSDAENFEKRIAALKIILGTEDLYIVHVAEFINPDLARTLTLQRDKAEQLLKTLNALQEENDALIAQLQQEELIAGEFGDLIPTADEDFIKYSEIEKIDMALSMLQSQIIFIGKNVECAQDVAEVLYNDLLTARNQYYSSLKNGTDENGEQISRAEARQLFRATCDGLIMEAMPILEKDHLSWGDFLQNLMKTIANAVIKVGSLFTVHNFFTPVKSTKEIITEAGNELQTDVDPKFTI